MDESATDVAPGDTPQVDGERMRRRLRGMSLAVQSDIPDRPEDGTIVS